MPSNSSVESCILLNEETRLSQSVTIGSYRSLVASGDRRLLSAFVRERFDERYFDPINNSTSKHGFTSLAVACVVIETLESFYQGLADTKGKSRRMFKSFFSRDTPLKVFGGDDDWFYSNIRCGILHQAETRGGWRILRKGDLLDINSRTINATKFLHELRATVGIYADQLEYDETLWGMFKAKMESICKNCE